jgi:hypothetical protein
LATDFRGMEGMVIMETQKPIIIREELKKSEQNQVLVELLNILSSVPGVDKIKLENVRGKLREFK